MKLSTLEKLIRNNNAYFDGSDKIRICVRLTSEETGKEYLLIHSTDYIEAVTIHEVSGVLPDGTIMLLVTDKSHEGEEYPRDNLTLYAPLDKHDIDRIASDYEQ